MTAVYLSTIWWRVLGSLVFIAFGLVVSDAQSIRVGTIKVGNAGYINNGQAMGSIYDVHNLILNNAQLDSINTVVPYQRLAVMLEQGKIDVTTASYPSSIGQNMHPIAMLFTSRVVVLAKKNLVIFTDQDLYGKTIAVLRGSSLSYFKQHPKILRYDLNSPAQGVKMLSLGRVDGVIASQYAIEATLAELGVSASDFSPPLHVATREYWLLYNKKTYNKEVVSRLKRSVNDLRDNGEIEEIFFRYAGDKRHSGVKIFGQDDLN